MIEFLSTFWPPILIGLDLVLSTAVTLHAVLRKRETDTIITWVGLAWLAPFVGALAYFCFGINRIQRKAISLKIGESLPATLTPPDHEEDFRLREKVLKAYPNLAGLAQLGKTITGKDLAPANTVTLLRDGEEAYPAMIEAIGQAENSISLLSYIFDHDRVGEEFRDALVEARERGVEIRVLIDHIGSRYSDPNMVGHLREHGLQVGSFLPTRAPRLARYANLRNHRKILVCDGRVGFTGGTNIREGHLLKLKPENPVQCTHFRLEGPVVRHLQEVFAVDWAFVTGEVLHDEIWFPKIGRSSGQVGARGVSDGPDEDFEKMTEVILGALGSARATIRIASPYFLPDPPILKALQVAALRGIEVKIVLPSKNNIPLVGWASIPLLGPLIEKGCQVYFSAPPFDHSKLFVIDGMWSLLGSTNWDPRSLRLNFEFNVECYHHELARQLEDLIDEKIAGGTQLTLADIEKRSLPVKLRDGLARLASPYL